MPPRNGNTANKLGRGVQTNDRSNKAYVQNVLICPKHVKVKHSSLKSANNPFTNSRETKLKRGEPLKVTFDKIVHVHTVPYWDPCGETFADSDTNKCYNGKTSKSYKVKTNHRQHKKLSIKKLFFLSRF
eukprot:UN03835